MKSFRNFIKTVNMWDPSKVYRVDPIERKNPWKSSDYAVTENGNGNWPSPDNQKPQGYKVGDTWNGNKIIDKVTRTFASPYQPNSLYAALGRSAGADGGPVPGVAIYDEDQMWGENRNPTYKGTIHITKDDYKRIPKQVNVHSADRTPDWKTESFSGKEEVTSPTDATNTSVQRVNTRDLLNSQYNVIQHDTHEDLIAAVRKQRDEENANRPKNNPISLVNQTRTEI